MKKIGAQVKLKNKAKLDYWLGSMDKIKPTSNKLDLWIKKYKPEYYLTEKLDGVSGLLTYTFDGKMKLFTRGTATHGLDITPLLKYIPNLPKIDQIKSIGKKNKMAFRGELIIPKKLFDKNWSKTMKNSRNAVAGLVNSKNINPKLATDTRFVVYEVVDPIYKFEKQMKVIKELKFDKVHHKIVQNIDYEFLSEYLKKRRNISKYLIDGIIVTNNEEHKRNTTGNPKYAFAFKDILEDQIATTKVIKVEWKISKNGFIKPTLVLEKVSIGGVDISRSSGFNGKFIFDNKIGPGTIIELIRSGDVIPYVKKIIKSTKAQMPTTKWHWNKTKVDIVCDEMKCDDILIRNIHYFFSKLDTKGLGEKIIIRLYDVGLDSILKILKADKKDFMKAEGIKEKSAQNLKNLLKML